MSEKFAKLGEQLNSIAFPVVLDAVRSGYAHPYAAWIERDISFGLKQTTAGYLIGPVHQGKSTDIEAQYSKVPQQLVEAVQECEFAQVSVTGGFAPGKWQLTSYKGIYAARDLPQQNADPSVYVGEDSLHFVDWVSSANPCTYALDLGAGSGISSVAISKLAKSVDAIEIDPVSCSAITITAALNGCESVNAVQADLTNGFQAMHKYDLIVGNTPGVPIPAGIAYSPAGNGGLDGLQISGAALSLSEELIATNGQIYLKFESIGDDAGPFSEKIVRDIVKRHGWSAQFIQHSRIPIELRSAISTRWAAPLNSGKSESSLLSAFDMHAESMNATYFYTCSVIITANATSEFLSLPIYRYGEWTLNTRPGGVGSEKSMAVKNYNAKLALLPDGLWELDIEKYLQLPVERIGALTRQFEMKASIKEATMEVFGDQIIADPIHARSLLVLTTLLAASLS